MPPAPARASVAALRAGIAVPVVYFGAQLAAAPFHPGYSFLRQDASTLGSPGSTAPWILNSGAFLTGVAMLFAAWGYSVVPPRLGASRALSWLAAAAMVGGALGSMNAALHPLPDPRHASGPFATLGSSLFVLPALLPLCIWRIAKGSRVRAYLVANLLAYAALLPIMSGLLQRICMKAGVEAPGLQALLNGGHGLLQRIAATVVFVPIAVCAVFLLERRRH